MVTGLESVQGVASQPSTVIASSSHPLGVKDNEALTATHEVRAFVTAYSVNVHGFRQIPTQDIVKDIQDAEKNISNVGSISGRAETAVIAIGSANTAMGQIDFIDSTYLQPLSVFNAVVTGIANVRLLKQRWCNFNLRSPIDPPIRPNGVDCVDHGIQGMHQSCLIPSINTFFNSSFCRKRIWMSPSQTSLPESNELTSSSWKTGRHQRSMQRKMC